MPITKLTDELFTDDGALALLAANADAADRSSEWPASSLDALRKCGAAAWSIEPSHGGRGLSSQQLLVGYERIASACLTTSFILSQREAAVRRLLVSSNESLKTRVLPRLAAGLEYATVGLSQLTTSRQHQAPSLAARPIGADDQPTAYRLEGVIPWVTGADQAASIIIGATLPDEQQILFLLPTGLPGVTIEPPAELAARAGSRTMVVHCAGVELPSELIVFGPAEKVLSSGSGGTGGVETSCLALGLAGAAIDFIADEASRRADLIETAERFGAERDRLRTQMHRIAGGAGGAAAAVTLRVACNRLVLQATQAALVVAKGAGFVSTHPAQRWARQALFFLVWSCPRPAAEGMLAYLTPEPTT